MNYRPFVSNHCDKSIDFIYLEKKVSKDGMEFLVESPVKPVRYKDISSASYSIHNRVLEGVALAPAPAVANMLYSLDGIDYASSIVDKLTSPSNIKNV